MQHLFIISKIRKIKEFSLSRKIKQAAQQQPQQQRNTSLL